MVGALGTGNPGRRGGNNYELPPMLAAKNLKPFISEELATTASHEGEGGHTQARDRVSRSAADVRPRPSKKLVECSRTERRTAPSALRTTSPHIDVHQFRTLVTGCHD